MRGIKSISIVLIFTLLISLCPVLEVKAQEGDLLLLKDVPLGSIVYDPTWKGLSHWETRERVIDWIVVAKNHPGYPSNSVTLFSKEVIKTDSFHNSDMNRWENSSIRSRTNNDVYNAFGNKFKQGILTTTLINKDADKNEYFTNDKVFIPSETELIGSWPASNQIGSKWEGINLNYLIGYSYKQKRDRHYWTRTPEYGTGGYVVYITSYGEPETTYADRSSDAYTLRAALNMRDGVIVKKMGKVSMKLYTTLLLLE